MAQIRGDFLEAQRIDSELVKKQNAQEIGRVNYGAGANNPRSFLANIEAPIPFTGKNAYWQYTNSLSDEEALREARSRGYAYAEGTSFHPGGMAIVGEKGPELVNLPRGSQVIPNGGMSNVFNFYGYDSEAISSKINNQIKLGY